VCVGAVVSTRGWSGGGSREAKIAPSFSLGAQACGVRGCFEAEASSFSLETFVGGIARLRRRCDGRRHAGHSASVQGLQGVRPEQQVRRRRHPAALQRVSPANARTHAPPAAVTHPTLLEILELMRS
jgi:hypothetical protein